MVWLLGLLVGAGLALAGCVVLWYGLRSVGTGLSVVRTPSSTLADALSSGQQSFVRGSASITDKLDRPETVTAPFSGREALAVVYEVRELRSQERSRLHTTGRLNFQKSWQTIDEGYAAVPFEIDDETAAAVVDPAKADPKLGRDQRTRVKGGRRPPEHIREFIDHSETVDSEERYRQLGPLKVRTGNDRRYVERRLEPGDDVGVFGIAERRQTGGVDGIIERGNPFVLSDASKRTTVRRYLVEASWFLAFAVALAGVGLLIVAISL